jgi:hypothetical protein
MGQRIIQRILECDFCGRTPKDGESIWEMGFKYMCEKCADNEDADNSMLEGE